MTQPDLPYLRLRLTVRPLSNPWVHRSGPSRDHPHRHPLPAIKLRRVLGKALIDLFCPFGRPRCQGRSNTPPHELCPQARECAYGVYFAASHHQRPPFALYVRPRQADSRAQQAEVTLFGDSWRLYPWMLAGLARALDGGIGKHRNRWWIDEVRQVHPDGHHRRLCGNDLADLSPEVQPDWVPLSPSTLLESFETTPAQPLEVRLLSPTRLLQDSQVLTGPGPVPLSLLVARTLDRLRGLYGDAANNLVPRNLEPRLDTEAAQVPIVRAQTRWVAQKDYSARSRKEFRLGGKMGHLVYGEGAERFLPILEVGEILQVGKNVTSGCGRIAVVG